MGQFQPGTSLELTRQTEKRLKRLERRANPGGRLGDVEAKVAQLSGRRRNRNGNFQINQHGYVSGAYLNPGQYSFDGWKQFGQLNLASNPVGMINGVPSVVGYTTSLGGFTTISGLTIPGLPSVTTAVRNTFTGASASGTFLNGQLGTKIPVVAGQTYAFSWWVRSSVAKTVTFNVQWANDSSSTGSISGTPVALTPNVWTLSGVTGVAPAGSTVAGVFSYQTSGNWAAGQTLDMTGVLIELGSTINPFYLPPSISFTAAPQGQQITFDGQGSFLAFPMERANIEAGDYVVSWTGTSQMAMANSGSAFPAFQSSPATFTLDGLADVYAIFSSGTIGEVQIERGTVPTVYEWWPIATELAICFRYFKRYDFPGQVIGPFAYYNTATVGFGHVIFPVPMRAAPTMTMSSLGAFLVFSNGTGKAPTAVTPIITAEAVRIQATTTASLVAAAGWMQMVEFIEFSAEL